MTSPSDGLVPWNGRAGDVRVGHILQGDSKAKKDVWEVVDTRNPNQYDMGQTPWLRVQRLGTEEIVAVPPKTIRETVTFMLTPDEFAHAEALGRPPHLPKVMLSDAAEVALLVESLDAKHLATRDDVTGEIWCPAYATGRRHSEDWRPGVLVKDELEHMRIAHGMDVTALEEITDWEDQMNKVIHHHGVAHRDNLPGGFPHRHVPEEINFL